MCKDSDIRTWRRWLTLIVLFLAGWLLVQSQIVRAAPPAAPLLGITPTFTPTITPTFTPVVPTSTPIPTPDPTRVDPAITKRGDPSEAYPGEEVTFIIEVTNNGPHAAVDVVVTDEVPEYFDILSATTSQGTVTVDGQTIIADIGTVGPGFVVEIVIHTRLQQDAPAPLSLENVASLNSPNGGSVISNPVIITILDPLLPVTGGTSPSWLAGTVLGVGLIILGLWLGIREKAPHSGLDGSEW
jgi:uncharacterized repeat protein (TIGR01451 family)